MDSIGNGLLPLVGEAAGDEGGLEDRHARKTAGGGLFGAAVGAFANLLGGYRSSATRRDRAGRWCGIIDEDHGLGHLLVEDHEWAWRLALVLWGVAGFLFVAVAIPPVRDVVFALDEWFYDTTYPMKFGVVTAVAWIFNFLGGGLFAWPFRALITVILTVRRRWESVTTWVLAIALSEPFIWLLKSLYGRGRPPEALVHAASGSFPSGHSIGGAVMAIGLVVVFVPAGAERRNLEIVAAAFALLMGSSRIYLGAHYLADVVAGVAFGAGVAIGSAVVVHRFFLRRVARRREEMRRRLSALEESPLRP